MALRTKSDFLWSAHAYGPQFIRAKPETFSFQRLTWDDGSFLAWFGRMSFEVEPEIPSQSFCNYVGSAGVPLFNRSAFYPVGFSGDFALPPVSPNKVD